MIADYIEGFREIFPKPKIALVDVAHGIAEVYGIVDIFFMF